MINDDFTGLNVSRQRKYQLRKQLEGKCPICGKPTDEKKFCEYHSEKQKNRITKYNWKEYYEKNKPKINEYQRKYWNEPVRKEKHNSKMKQWRKNHIIQVMAWRLNTKHKIKITATQLFGIIKRQKRLCPLTGRKLTSDNISIDHITHRKNGGDGSLDNIRFVVNDVNKARGVLSDNQLLELCKDVVNTLS